MHDAVRRWRYRLELVNPCVLEIFGLAAEVVQLGFGFLATGKAAEDNTR